MTKNLTEGSPMRLIFFFTMPLIAGNIFQQLYAFVDTLIVGRILGVEALAAVGCTGPLMFLMLGFVMGTATGFSIYTGQRFGAKDEDGVRQSMAACIILSVLCAAVLTAIGVLLCRHFLVWMQTPEEIIENAHSFIRIIFSGIVIPFFFMMLTNIIRALGDSRAPTVMLAAALCVNIALEPIFIMVFGWGVPGAALAVIAAQLTGALVCLLYIWKNLPILHVRREDWRLPRSVLLEHLRLGLPMGFQASIIAIGAVILQAALNQLGPTAVAAYAASQKVDTIAMMPMMSFGMAMAAYSAQNYGARKFSRIIEGVKKCILMSMSFSVLAGLFNAIFGVRLIWLFVGDGAPQVIDYGQTYLVVNGSFYWVLSLLFIFRSTLQGLGSTIVPTIAGIMELVMRTVAALVLVRCFGYLGACFASPLAWIGSCLPLAIAFAMTSKSLRRSAQHEAAG